MKQVIISIGNTDNKLTQQEWAKFVEAVDKTTAKYQRFFRGFPPGDAPWQNAAWWIQVPEADIPLLKRWLSDDACTFGQDSIAVVVGETEFISSKV